MAQSLTIKGTPDVTEQIFEKFLEELTNAGVSSELVARLHKTLLEEQTYTERSLKTAFIGEEQSE